MSSGGVACRLCDHYHSVDSTGCSTRLYHWISHVPVTSAQSYHCYHNRHQYMFLVYSLLSHLSSPLQQQQVVVVINHSKLQEWQKGSLKKKKVRLSRMYKVHQKELSIATEEVRQRLVPLSARLQQYEARHKQWRQNQLFRTDQKQLYQELGGQEKAKQSVPDATESQKFWSDLWDQPAPTLSY